jgi:hypothetical protein
MGYGFKTPIFTLKEDGDANFYTILRDRQWFARIQMNGEMRINEQELYLRKLLDALNQGI